MPYAYHATSRAALAKLARTGLVPRRRPAGHSDEKRAVRGPVVFFAPLERLALAWGEVLLRFPWPEDFLEDGYGDTLLLPTGELVRSSYYTAQAVPPEVLDVKVGRRWRPLLG
jgi:hypothetical protein